MQEDRRTHSIDRRVVVVAQHHDQVVDGVVAPHPLGADRVGQAHGAIIGWIARGVAPAVVARDRRLGQGGGRAVGIDIGPIQHPADRPDAQWAPVVTLALVGRRDHPGLAQRAAHGVSVQRHLAVGMGAKDHRAAACPEAPLAPGAAAVHVPAHGATQNPPPGR